jgi:hypothetical protein
MKIIKVETKEKCPYKNMAYFHWKGDPDTCQLMDQEVCCGPASKDCPLEEMPNLLKKYARKTDPEKVREQLERDATKDITDGVIIARQDKLIARLKEMLIEERAKEILSRGNIRLWDNVLTYDASVPSPKGYRAPTNYEALGWAKEQIEKEL